MRLPSLTYNFLSAVGATIAVIAALLFVVLFLVIMSADQPNPYLGILLYMAVPGLLVFGLLLIPIGMFRQYKRRQRGELDPEQAWPALDLNKRSHRNATFVFVIGTVVFMVISAVGAYEAYHFTESNNFCGTTCHEVMHPEHIAYQNSSHARVSCVECHIGSGAGWFVKSKLSGTYQVYAVLANKYPKPIPTPIANLRPAQETCEECHWPQRFFGAQQIQFNHYMYNEESTPWPINMLIKTGGGDPQTGQTSGIHWHMNIGVKVDYIARDERRLDIPWVRVTDRRTGRVTVYQNEEDPLSEEEIQAATPRTMDCMDCHNRPSHNYYPPDQEVDVAILTGRIDRGIPEIKRIAVEAMTQEYSTSDDAQQGIANYVTEFYRKRYADQYEDLRVAIDEAIVSTQEAFAHSIFPDMKVSWANYPDHIGHFIYPGCMRCHEGRHVDQEGIVLTRECHTCHIIMAQGSGERAEVAQTAGGLEFVHPEDIGEAWREMGCYECHSGVQP